MKAKFAGKCRRCGGPIKPGDEIDWTKDTGAQHPKGQCVEAPVVARNVPHPDLKPGVYELEDVVYVVRPSRTNEKNLIALRMMPVSGNRMTESGDIVKIRFVYERGAVLTILPEHQMSLTRARELVTLYRHCIRCGKKLGVDKSVEAGVGPTCKKYFVGGFLEPVKNALDQEVDLPVRRKKKKKKAA